MRVALDINILAYLAGVSRSAEDDGKVARVRDLVERLARSATLLAPTQTLGELFVVLRRGGTPPEQARDIVLRYAEAFTPSPSEERTVVAALDLTVNHKFQFWDALIVTSAVDAGCQLLLSEDMQDGFVVRGLTITNPLAAKPHAKLAALMQE